MQPMAILTEMFLDSSDTGDEIHELVQHDGKPFTNWLEDIRPCEVKDDESKRFEPFFVSIFGLFNEADCWGDDAWFYDSFVVSGAAAIRQEYTDGGYGRFYEEAS